jgi:hypothetical protein
MLNFNAVNKPAAGNGKAKDGKLLVSHIKF